MNSHKISKKRRGVMAVIAVVCVMVASTIMVVAVRRMVAESKLMQLEARQSQCRWLAESGLERAAARLATDRRYAGEVWKIPAAAMGRADRTIQDAGATVKIEVSTPRDQPARRVVRVLAEWPQDAALRVRQSKEVSAEIGG